MSLYKYKGKDLETLLEPKSIWFNDLTPDFGNFKENGESLAGKFTNRYYLTNPLENSYKQDSVNIDPAARGTLPTASLFCSKGPGTYTISRTDSTLTISGESAPFTPSSFPRINAIPKVIGVYLVGGGGGGAGTGGLGQKGGGGGSGAGRCIGVINLTAGTFSLTVGGGGGGGGGTSGGQSQGGNGGDTSISLSGKYLTAYGGKGNGTSGAVSGSGYSGTSASSLESFTAHILSGANGGDGHGYAAGGGRSGAISAYLSQHKHETYLSFDDAGGGGAGTGPGRGGGGGGSHGSGGEGGGSFGPGYSGGTGAGGGGGSTGLTAGSGGGSGGSGLAYFYY